MDVIYCPSPGGTEWGAVSTWVSAVVTTLALAVTGFIVWRDRRKDQRADAHYVAVRGHDPDDQEGDGQGVIVSNQAKRTIFDVRAHIFADAEGGYTLLDHRIDAYMDPKQTSQSFYDVSVLGDGFLYGITFTDTDGHLWLRDCLNRELIKLPSGRPVLAVGNHLKRRERGSRLRFPRSWPGAKRMWKTS